MNEVIYGAGDEVLLGGDARVLASMANSALRGVVVARHRVSSSEAGYTVRFPGRLGVVRLPVGALLPAAPFEPIRLGARYVASTLDEAVGVLLEIAARVVRCQARGETLARLDILGCRTIAAAIEQRCHMLPGQILDQLAPEAAMFLKAGPGGVGYVPHPARLARRDVVVVPKSAVVPPRAARRRPAAESRLTRAQLAGAR